MKFKLNNSGQIGQVFAGEIINVGIPGPGSQATTRTSSAGGVQAVNQEEVRTPSASPSRACLRRLLNELLPTDAVFSAFCHDHFHEIYAQFGIAMEREQKNTLLLQYAPRLRIYQLLQRLYPGPLMQRSSWIKFTGSE